MNAPSVFRVKAAITLPREGEGDYSYFDLYRMAAEQGLVCDWEHDEPYWTYFEGDFIRVEAVVEENEPQ